MRVNPFIQIERLYINTKLSKIVIEINKNRKEKNFQQVIVCEF